MLLLVVGGVAAYAVANLTDDDSSGGGGGGAPTTGGAVALPIVEAADFDPLGEDQSEHSSEAPLAIDRDPGSAWETSTYSTRNFGNTKSGVGLWVKLDRPHDLTSVTVTTRESGWSAQIYVADRPGSSLEAWGQPRATGDDLQATHPFSLDGARGEYVLVWCTQLPPSNKLQIGDIKVEGR